MRSLLWGEGGRGVTLERQLLELGEEYTNSRTPNYSRSLGLVRAAEKYDPGLGFKFSTYAR